MKAASETSLVKACLALLAACGIVCWRNNSGAARVGRRLVRFGEVGSPDILAIHPGSGGLRAGRGKLVCVECKVGRNKPTAAQSAWLGRAEDHGAVAVVVYSVADLESWLRAEGLL